MRQFDEAVAHTIKHFELHRLDGLEWRVISDVEAGVIAITAVEEAVLRRFATLPNWPHTVVTFFVLQDLSALQRQLAARDAAPQAGAHAAMSLPAGGISGLAQRPVVNLYDLANPEACHVFVNYAAMAQAGYWGDALAETALLAHEHAHPLVENPTVQASRQVTVASTLASRAPISPHPQAQARWLARLQAVTQSVCERLCSYAPRELFTNSLAVTAGFGEALCHLDRITIERSALALPGRQALVAGLRAEDELTAAGRNAFLVLADLRAHLEMAFEVAAFQRTGAEACARELETLLRTKVFPGLAPEVASAFTPLTQRYVELATDLTPTQFIQFAQSILDIIAAALVPSGIVLHRTISLAEGKEG